MKRRHFFCAAASCVTFPAISTGATRISEGADLLSWLAPTDCSASGRAVLGFCEQAGMTQAEAVAAWSALRERISQRLVTRNQAAAQAALADIVCEDFSRGECINVEGWHLARSEVILNVLSTVARG